MGDEAGWTSFGVISDGDLDGLASQISRDKPTMVRVLPDAENLRVDIRERSIGLNPTEYHQLPESRSPPITKQNVAISLAVATQGIREGRLGGVIWERMRRGSVCYYSTYLKYGRR